MLQKRRTARATAAIDHETVENDARALLLTNTRHGFHNRAREWRDEGGYFELFFKTDSRNSVVGIGPPKN
jgi:hypothetical protein